jgi:CheY-like chemotaxis protein
MKLKNVAVLVVEDDAENRASMEAALRSEGALVKSAASADEAVALLSKRWRPSVLVSDLGLPNEGGCSMMRRIRKMGIKAPALAITGGAGEPREAFLAGFQLHVSKPFRHETLVRMIETLGGG